MTNPYRPCTRLNIIDVTGGSLYLLDVIMGFTIGMRMIWRDKEALVMDGVLVAEFYVTKASAVLDIIAALPTIPIVRRCPHCMIMHTASCPIAPADCPALHPWLFFKHRVARAQPAALVALCSPAPGLQDALQLLYAGASARTTHAAGHRQRNHRVLLQLFVFHRRPGQRNRLPVVRGVARWFVWVFVWIDQPQAMVQFPSTSRAPAGISWLLWNLKTMSTTGSKPLGSTRHLKSSNTLPRSILRWQQSRQLVRFLSTPTTAAITCVHRVWQYFAGQHHRVYYQLWAHARWCVRC